MSAAIVHIGADETFISASCRDTSALCELVERLERDRILLERAEEMADIGSWRSLDFAKRKVLASAGACQVYGLEPGEFTIAAIEAIPLPEYRPFLNTGPGRAHAGREALAERRVQDRPQARRRRQGHPLEGQLGPGRQAALSASSATSPRLRRRQPDCGAPSRRGKLSSRSSIIGPRTICRSSPPLWKWRRTGAAYPSCGISSTRCRGESTRWPSCTRCCIRRTICPGYVWRNSYPPSSSSSSRVSGIMRAE